MIICICTILVRKYNFTFAFAIHGEIIKDVNCIFGCNWFEVRGMVQGFKGQRCNSGNWEKFDLWQGKLWVWWCALQLLQLLGHHHPGVDQALTRGQKVISLRDFLNISRLLARVLSMPGADCPTQLIYTKKASDRRRPSPSPSLSWPSAPVFVRVDCPVGLERIESFSVLLQKIDGRFLKNTGFHWWWSSWWFWW